MVPRRYRALLGGIGLCSFLMAVTPPLVWSASDKTIVDLERGLPEAPSRYHRPRGAPRYRADKTEVDLAVPLTQEANGPQPAKSPSPTPSVSTPGTLLPLQPPPSGGR